MISYKNGVDISLSSNKIREYSSFIGLKYGNWKDYSKYTDLVILTSRLKANIATNVGGVNHLSSPLNMDLSYINKCTNIYLMTPNHWQKILIKICKNKIEADKIIGILNSRITKNIGIFNPQLPDKTKSIKMR